MSEIIPRILITATRLLDRVPILISHQQLWFSPAKIDLHKDHRYLCQGEDLDLSKVSHQDLLKESALVETERHTTVAAKVKSSNWRTLLLYAECTRIPSDPRTKNNEKDAMTVINPLWFVSVSTVSGGDMPGGTGEGVDMAKRKKHILTSS